MADNRNPEELMQKLKGTAMPEEKKKTGEIPAEQSELTENDLEGVSGGLWGITIMDGCNGYFIKEICVTSFFGRCPRLVDENQRGDYQKTGDHFIETVTTYSCTKGCFNKLRVTVREEQG